jgi:drug/metabolite transporter (DMT)-like permease
MSAPTDERERAGPIGALLAVVAGPYVLLSFAILCWSGNFVVGRLAHLDVPPIALSFWRHLFAAALILPFALGAVVRDLPALRARWRAVAVLSAVFVAGNSLVYFAVLHTTVTNAALINAGVPVMAVFFSWLLLRDLINRWQALGIGFCFLGIAIVVTRADLGLLLALGFGWGDLFMLLAIACWALYMVLLKRARLAIAPVTLLAAVTVGGVLWLVPAYGVEIAAGATMTWSWLSAASLLYVALFSTIVAWACWNFGTLRIGPNRASAFMSLHPVFGAALGFAFFDERLEPFHLYGTVLVLVGVFLVSRAWKRTVRA